MGFSVRFRITAVSVHISVRCWIPHAPIASPVRQATAKHEMSMASYARKLVEKGLKRKEGGEK